MKLLIKKWFLTSYHFSTQGRLNISSPYMRETKFPTHIKEQAKLCHRFCIFSCLAVLLSVQIRMTTSDMARFADTHKTNCCGLYATHTDQIRPIIQQIHCHTPFMTYHLHVSAPRCHVMGVIIT
jgi:hypothetical protein